VSPPKKKQKEKENIAKRNNNKNSKIKPRIHHRIYVLYTFASAFSNG
jgi:hypothetical protein